MNCSESLDKIAPALVAAQAELGAVAKSGHNPFDKYDYATLGDYVAAVKPVLTKHGLAVLFGAQTGDNGPRTTSTGKNENGVFIECDVVLLHESGQFLSVPAVGEGQDRADKGVYKALTGARKYAIAAMFNLATADYPEKAAAPATTKSAPRKASPKVFDFEAVPDSAGLQHALDIALAKPGSVSDWRAFCNGIAARALQVTKIGTPERTALADSLKAARTAHVKA